MFNYITRAIAFVIRVELFSGNSSKITGLTLKYYLPLILFSGTWQCDT